MTGKEINMAEAVNKAMRKYLGHLLDANMDLTYENTDYVLLGADLEEYVVDLSVDVEKKENILNEKSVNYNEYDVGADVDPFYYKYNDALSGKVLDIALERKRNEECMTSYLDVLMEPPKDLGGTPTVIKAYREDVYIIPQSYGGDPSGIQIPFRLEFTGRRVKGMYDLTTKKFTPEGEGL